MRNIEKEILDRAIEAFRKNAPEETKIEALAPGPDDEGAFMPDRILRVMLHGRKLKYHAQIKTTVTRTHLLLLIAHRDKLRHPPMLIAKHVNAKMAEELKLSGMEFLDAAGNAFIHRPPICIFIKGNRPPDMAGKAHVKRAFKATGLKMMYGFLCNPGMENETYRDIAAATGVALGTVDWIMKELLELGFLIEMGRRGLKLTRKENLLQRWVAAYPEQLRPKQLLGRFRGKPGWRQKAVLVPGRAHWGGEVAAARLTQYLEPRLTTIYVEAGHLDRFLFDNRLQRDMAGDVEILARFWRPAGKNPDEDLVHPILVYADLLATGDQRNLEAARMIYEQHIVRSVRED